MVLNVLPDFATDAEKVLMADYHAGDTDEDRSDEAQWIAFAVEDRFRDYLEAFGMTADWIDGEFFVMEEDLEFEFEPI
tara:strand:+ start:1016 stop:1249 length:234 start_codon:yes stop_codon:yes gene_type:complete